MTKYLDISQEVREALDNRRPVVALESAIISYGAPYPQNVETTRSVEQIIRDHGAAPATIAIIGGRLKCGLSETEIEYIGKKQAEIVKCSRRDIPVVISKKLDGAATAATAMIIANMAGVRIFAAGGIGGVHRGAETSMDISADLEELGRTPIMAVCAGARAILDLGLTLEYLETKGVPVIGYGTDELPAFYCRNSGLHVDYRLDTPRELAEAFEAQRGCGLHTGMLIANPIPEKYAMDFGIVNQAINEAIEEAAKKGIHGKALTPFLFDKVKDLTGGGSLQANIQLVYNNAKVAAQTAAELCKL